MAGDSTNRFLWHEGEVEGDSEDDEIPREWPAYRRAYAALCRAQADSKDGVLGSNWQVLANSCSTTSLGMYKTGMRRLRQTHMARPEWGPYKVVEQVVCDAIREGKGSSSVKTILNAAAMAYTMGVVSELVPKRLWKAFKAAQRLEEKSTQEWGSFEALQIMAHQADSELEWCVVGLAVLSTLLGLSVGEAASISFHRLGVLAGTAEFYDRKVHRAWITRTVSGVALKWLQFCAWIAQRCWNLDKFQRLVSEDKLQNVMATLLRGSKWKDIRWHAWRRRGPATMYKAGGKIPSIKAWFRWRSTRTAMAYINCPHPGKSSTHSQRLLPPVTSRGGRGLRERQPGGVRSSRPLRPTISLSGTPQRGTPEIPRAPGHPHIAPHLGRPMVGGERGERGDAAREEAARRTACGAGGGGDIETGITRRQAGQAARAAKVKMSHGSWRRKYGRSVGHI